MSVNDITSQVVRLTEAKSALREKLIARGVTVGESETLSDYPAHIDEIPSGGEQPTLFAPTITESNGTVSWTSNTQNGGFPETLTAELDGIAVTSPLTVTPSMVGKTLTVTVSAENFVSASADLTLTTPQYVISAGSYTFVNVPTGDTGITQDIVFTSYGLHGPESFVGMVWDPPRDISYIKSSGGYEWALDLGSWMYNYKSISISTDQIVSADFYNWFTANTT